MKRTLRKLTVSIKREDLSTEKTIYQILKKEGGIKKKIEAYLNWLKEEYPSAKVAIEKVWNNEKTQKDWTNYSDDKTDTTKWLEFIRYFTFEKDIVDNVKKEAEGKLKQLFTINDSDNDDIKKNLKSQPIEGLIADFKLGYKADQIAWSVELCRIFYLERLPIYIEEGLKEKTPILTLNDLKKEDWEKSRKKIFDHLYNTWKRTVDESDIKSLETKLGEDIVELSDLIEQTQTAVANDLQADKEKYKKKDSKGNAWDLNEQEKAKIDQAANKQELEKVVTALEKTYAERKETEKVDQWVEEHISKKTKIEELPSEKDIDDAAEIPAQFKEEVKLKRWEKEIDLTPKATTIEGKIKQHLTEVLYKWKKWGFLFDNNKKGDNSYIVALVFNENFREQIAKDLKSKIEAAIKTDTLEGYRKLDKEWGDNKTNEKGEVEYDAKREFMAAWSTLRELLKEEENSKYNKIRKHMITNYYEETRWKEIEFEAQIEVTDKQN